MNCCGLTIATIGNWLAHRLNEHTIDFLASLSEQTRVRMALAMYSNAACVAWAKSVPIMVLTEEKNVKVPDIFDQEFGDLIFLINAPTIVEHVLTRYNNARLAYKAMNKHEDYTKMEIRKIMHELVEEGIIMALKNILYNIETKNEGDWMIEIQAATAAGRSQGQRNF